MKEVKKNTLPPKQLSKRCKRDYFKERKEKRKREEHKYEKMAMNKYLSIITLNVNGLNAPIKRLNG